MGNRGILHDDRGRMFRPFAHKNWVTCVLAFKGRHRQVMTQAGTATCSSWMKPRPWQRAIAPAGNGRAMFRVSRNQDKTISMRTGGSG